MRAESFMRTSLGQSGRAANLVLYPKSAWKLPIRDHSLAFDELLHRRKLLPVELVKTLAELIGVELRHGFTPYYFFLVGPPSRGYINITASLVYAGRLEGSVAVQAFGQLDVNARGIGNRSAL